MLNLNCVICAELFTHSDEVHVTVCGHMFHHSCLKQWMDRSKTCPQCRNKCTTRNIFRVYFNLANLDVSHIDVGSLQEQLDNAKLAMKMKEQEHKKADQQVKELKETQKKCLKTIAGLEQKVQKRDFTLSSYVEQISILKNDARVVDELRKENKNLKQQIHTMESISAILTAGSAEAEALLKNETNPHVLANWVSTLKRELRQCETKKTELRNVLKLVQNDLRKELECKRKLDEQISQLESDLYRAQEQLKSGTVDLTVNNNIATLKQDERRSTISPTTKQNIKLIHESTSPYLNIKSSSVGMAHLLKAPSMMSEKISPIKCSDGISMTGAIRKTTSDLSEKYSIFKKPRLGLGATSSGLRATMRPNFVYNGMGGSEKVDPFNQQQQEEKEEETENHQIATIKTINARLKSKALRNIKLPK
ncbi:nopo [Drosophila busckii]|uniref:Nopo n=1 Tax=Drosophila busckii TaxID=30019 RepID=A0A0M5IY38_DROBS|nr:E3 ubiquitin-protein ligase TRAIP [Drosophila busckii]ALC42581.1 nopo [Drosophila busckii]